MIGISIGRHTRYVMYVSRVLENGQKIRKPPVPMVWRGPRKHFFKIVSFVALMLLAITPEIKK